MNGMNKIVKNYFYNVLYNILVLVVPLVTAPYLARVLGASNLGIYSYVNSVTSIIISVSIIGLYSYGSRQVAYERDNKERLSQLFWNLMSLRFILCLIGTLLYFGYAVNTAYADYFALYYIYYLGNALDCTWLFVGVEEMKIPSIKNIFAKLLSVVGIFAFVRTSDDLVKYIFLLAFATFSGILLTYPQIRKYVTFMKPDIRSYKEHLKGALILFLPSLVSTVYLQMDKVMIEWLTNETSQISFYDQAEKIVMIPLTFITVLSSVMMPRIANEFAHNHKENICHLLAKACRVSMLMAFPLMLGIAAIADDFIPWYLGQDFMATATTLKILAPIVLSNTLVGISGTQYFIATNQTQILLKSNISASVMNVVVNALLIPKFGYLGAGVATVLSNYTLVVVQYRAMAKQVDIRKMFEHTWKYLVIAPMMYCVVSVYGYFRPAIPFTTFTQILIGIILYITVLIIIRDDVTLEGISAILKKGRKNE